jgi:cytidylate kinase
MVSMQQALSKTRSMILDGRDIGTKVLTGATLKVFLTATPEERAKRRYDQLLRNGQTADYQKVLNDVIARDHQDSTRAIDPLRPAEDAMIVDNTDFTQAQTVQAVLELLEAKV